MDKGQLPGDRMLISKPCLSSDRSLQLGLREAGFASNRASAMRGEYVPGLVHTARQAMGAGGT